MISFGPFPARLDKVSKENPELTYEKSCASQSLVILEYGFMIGYCIVLATAPTGTSNHPSILIGLSFCESHKCNWIPRMHGEALAIWIAGQLPLLLMYIANQFRHHTFWQVCIATFEARRAELPLRVGLICTLYVHEWKFSITVYENLTRRSVLHWGLWMAWHKTENSVLMK